MTVRFIPPIIWVPIWLPWVPPWGPGPADPVPEDAEKEFVEHIQKFAKNNTQLIEMRYKQAEGDLVYAAHLLLCDAGLDKDVPKETYFAITGIIPTIVATRFVAGVILGLLSPKDKDGKN